MAPRRAHRPGQPAADLPTAALPELYPVAAVTVAVLLWAVAPMSVRRVPSWLVAAGLGVVAAVVVLGVVGRRVLETATSLQVAVEACIDAAEHLIASEGLRAPESYADAFTALGEAGVLDPVLTTFLEDAARFGEPARPPVRRRRRPPGPGDPADPDRGPRTVLTDDYAPVDQLQT